MNITETIWKINISLWTEQYLNDRLQPLFDRIADEMEEQVGSHPVLGFKPIDIRLDAQFGPTLYWPLQKGQYRLGLKLGKDEYAKAVMQFAHALCHLYIDPRVNNWFIESICQMTGYFFLDLFADLYNGYEVPVGFEDKGQSFSDYYKERIKALYKQIDLVQHQHSSDWIKQEVRSLVCDKKWNALINDMVALELLKLFKTKPVMWQIIPFIGLSTSPLPPRDKRNLSSTNLACPDFEMLKEIVPIEFKAHVEAILERVWE
jgi:hypothetical protein